MILQRKLEREYALYGGIPPTADAEPDEIDEHREEDTEQVESIAGMFFKSTPASTKHSSIS